MPDNNGPIRVLETRISLELGMPIRNIPNGYIYVMTTEFGPDQVVTISKSKNDPNELVSKANENSLYGLVGVRPAEILYSKELNNCTQIESLVHQFLIHNDYSTPAIKDYQIHFMDAISLIEKAVKDLEIPAEFVLKIRNTNTVSLQNIDYFKLGTIFDGTTDDYTGDLFDSYQIDNNVAFQCYLKGYECDDDRCLSKIGLAYEQGIGVNKNLDKALKVYQEYYQLNKFSGIENVFRAYLKLGKEYKASALLLDFFSWCERENFNESLQNNEGLGECLDLHEDFVSVLGAFVWESFYQYKNFKILAPFTQYFHDFQKSIFKRLQKDYRFLKSQQFIEMSEKISLCSDTFENYLSEFEKKIA